MSEKPLTISELINSLKAIYTHLCKEPKEIKIMIDFCREEGDVLRKFALIK